MSNNNGTRYEEPTKEYLDDERVKLGEFISIYQNSLSVTISTDEEKANSIIRRLHQRQAYYLYFHGKEINQAKQAAVIAYWIMKYRPFVIEDTEGKKGMEYGINAHMAYRVMAYNAIGFVKKEKQIQFPGCTFGLNIKQIPGEMEHVLLHTLSECDSTKESMIAISSSLLSFFRVIIKKIS